MTDPSAGPIVAVVQARLGSQRMPGKVLSTVLGTPALKVLLHRLGRSELANEIVLAIPEGAGDDPLAEFASSHGVRCVRGSETDVLDRYRIAAELTGASVVVRITGDCPMVDPLVVDEVIQALLDSGADYARTSEWFPDGFDVEALTATSLLRAAGTATESYDREHVTSCLPAVTRVVRLKSTEILTLVSPAPGISLYVRQ